jgi:catechol 2,3-dioxygenase-like lactoylglutathione lyase family enzyme
MLPAMAPAGSDAADAARAAVASAPAVTLDEIVLADPPERWGALGFDVRDARVRLGSASLRLAGEDAGRGIVAWSLRGIERTELDGLPTTVSGSQLPDRRPGSDRAEHPNGITAIDHVVAMTPDLDRSVRALQRAGLDLRRLREEPTPAGAPRQAFFRLGEAILEVVQEPERVLAERGRRDGPARLWGLALLAPDLDRTVATISPHAGAVRDAVQPGRRIATLKRSAGLAVPVALMSERPPRSPDG